MSKRDLEDLPTTSRSRNKQTVESLTKEQKALI
jgi:hypothetical protein